MTVDSARADGPGGRAAIRQANSRVAASAGNRASVAACSQASTSRRAKAERTLRCIPLLSSPIGANRKSSNSEGRDDIERDRCISVTEYNCIYRLHGTIHRARRTRPAGRLDRNSAGSPLSIWVIGKRLPATAGMVVSSLFAGLVFCTIQCTVVVRIAFGKVFLEPRVTLDIGGAQRAFALFVQRAEVGACRVSLLYAAIRCRAIRAHHIVAVSLILSGRWRRGRRIDLRRFRSRVEIVSAAVVPGRRRIRRSRLS
jgi:hypothetical protein